VSTYNFNQGIDEIQDSLPFHHACDAPHRAVLGRADDRRELAANITRWKSIPWRLCNLISQAAPRALSPVTAIERRSSLILLLARESVRGHE
jgi:hypothetical protein